MVTLVRLQCPCVWSRFLDGTSVMYLSIVDSTGDIVSKQCHQPKERTHLEERDGYRVSSTLHLACLAFCFIVRMR